MKSLNFAAAAFAVAAVLAPAAVMAAQATGAVNVRSGPSTSYRVVDRLARGENVNVQRCRTNGWCYITHPGPDGWVSARYLRDNGGRDDVYRGGARPSFSFSFSFGQGGGNPGGGGNTGGGQAEELVCLVTFFEADQVEGGANLDVERARLLPRSEAERRDGPNDRQRIFTYGSPQNTRETCRELNDFNY